MSLLRILVFAILWTLQMLVYHPDSTFFNNARLGCQNFLRCMQCCGNKHSTTRWVPSTQENWVLGTLMLCYHHLLWCDHFYELSPTSSPVGAPSQHFSASLFLCLAHTVVHPLRPLDFLALGLAILTSLATGNFNFNNMARVRQKERFLVAYMAFSPVCFRPPASGLQNTEVL